ncbi:beta-lactamase family protein [Wangella sp. NEAU-J3]|nr:serine hydrolase domain-containing protein [Jidongwangia harbinensis]MCA2218120.1 beta-lactamase family protein [Jidongwangia harbinensis]
MALAALAGLVASGIAAAQPAAAESRDRALQSRLESMVKAGHAPGVLASVRDRKGHITNYTAGVGNLRTKAKVPVDGYVRIASNTKMYTAVVVLQLVGEGRIGLDTPVEEYLPGLVRGKGIDGRKITIRQLLQHTSLLPNYDLLPNGILQDRHTFREDHDLLQSGLTTEERPDPGVKFSYSNTNYILAGLVVQKVTGRPIGEEITNRIIRRVGLRHTYWPGEGDQTVRGAHPRGYVTDPATDKLVDITELDPSMAGAAGRLVATPSDVNRFMVALQDGRLLKAPQLAEMRKSVPAENDLLPGWRYGLGAFQIPLSCGGSAWGHGGDMDGYQSRTGVTADGRAVTIVLTRDELTSLEALNDPLAALDAALCAGKPSRR